VLGTILRIKLPSSRAKLRDNDPGDATTFGQATSFSSAQTSRRLANTFKAFREPAELENLKEKKYVSEREAERNINFLLCFHS